MGMQESEEAVETRPVSGNGGRAAGGVANRLRAAAEATALAFLVFAPLWDVLGWSGALPAWWPPVSYVMIAAGIAAGCLAVLVRTLQRRVRVRGERATYAGGRGARGTLLELVAMGLLLGAWILRGDAEIPPDPPLVVAGLIALAVLAVAVRLRMRAAALLVLVFAAGCDTSPGRLVLATTSSAHDSGLLDEVADAWSREPGTATLAVLVTGSGEALALGRRGDADLLLVHAPASERAFMGAGHGLLRLPVMSNTMLLVGPADDPADVDSASDVLDAFLRIDTAGTFVSRGDDSGTHQRELGLRREAGLADVGAAERYLDAGSGMDATLRLASERGAYTLTDRATWEVVRPRLQLREFTLADERLHNPYSIIVPRQARDTARAARFARWLAGPLGQAVIRSVRGSDGQPLFMPAADDAHAPNDAR
jgi:tungstate transport system substrate-binding protein